MREEVREEEYMEDENGCECSSLQAELHREGRSDTDMCCVCSMGAVESQAHMLVECTAYQNERLAVFVALECILGDEQCSKQWNDVEELSVWLLSDERCDGPIRTFLDAAFAVRLALTGTPAKALL